MSAERRILTPFECSQDPGRIIFACSEDMIKLWRDPVIQKVLTHQRIRLQDEGGL